MHDEPRNSFGRCLLHSKFLERFYDLLMASSPEIREMFQNTDMGKQRELLRTGLSMMIMYEHGKGIAAATLDRLGKTHGDAGMRITSEMYAHWIESIVGAVRECDPSFSPALEERWRMSMGRGIARMRGVQQAS